MESSRPGLVLKPSRQPCSLASHGGRGSWVITSCFPRSQLGRDWVKRLALLSFHGGADLEAELCQGSLLSPFRPGYGGEAQRSAPALRRARWGRRQIPKTGASGEGGGRSTDCASLWRGSELEAPRSESRVHPPCRPSPHPYTKAIRRPGLQRETALFVL